MFVSGVSLRLEKRLILWTHRAPYAKWKPVACCNVFCFLIGVFALCRRQRFSEHHYFAKVCVHGGLSACAWKAHWSELKLTRILQARGLLADLWPSWTKPKTYSKLSKRFLIQTGTGISSTTFEIVFFVSLAIFVSRLALYLHYPGCCMRKWVAWQQDCGSQACLKSVGGTV